MTLALDTDIRIEAAVQVTLLLGRYLHDSRPIAAIAANVADRWADAHRGGDPRSFHQWWDDYVGAVESAAGGVDCATEESLRALWQAHARRLGGRRP